ncbi:hypothetical protein AFV9_gp16 [Betalipothrixvirus uzonense]|uniref:Uncharacterized protein n=1 Tax=Betalipothrixvirus uzonense TaxID=512792 RepID=B2CRJ3_9VIRU|nr:hypothetical protein AFV9_gp16 [Acidianus filamentous virus 9]ACB37250.1 hypothetical protein [Acidianus filamentous virus 9]
MSVDACESIRKQIEELAMTEGYAYELLFQLVKRFKAVYKEYNEGERTLRGIYPVANSSKYLAIVYKPFDVSIRTLCDSDVEKCKSFIFSS